METPSIAYMKGYFAQAAELERHIFVLQKSMKKANQEMLTICKEKETAEQKQQYCKNQLSQLDQKYIDTGRKLTEQEMKNQKNYPKFKKLAFTIIAMDVVLGCIAIVLGIISLLGSILLGSNPENLLFIFLSLASSLIPFICMIIVYSLILAVIFFAISRQAKNRLKSAARDLEMEKSNEKDSLHSDIRTYQCKSMELEQSKTDLVHMQDLIAKNYREATAALQRLYGKNLIASKYHNFQAMATFYEYLSTGRCLVVFGAGGVVDTYEKDIQAQIIINHLSNIEAIVLDTNLKMGYLCDQAEQANRQLARMNTSLESIKISSAATAANTAQIKDYCNSINESIYRMERNYF